MQKNRYTRLADQERESISRGLAQHKPIRQIAKELDRFPSTISREVRRNRGKTGYRAFSASRRAKAAASSRKRGKRKIEKQEGLLSYVIEKLQGEWSPEEISKRLKIEYAWDMNMQVSHEPIYQYIYVLPRGELKKSLTYEQVKEMSEHEQFTIDTGIQVYFAHPGSPLERGTNENTNGLIRQYFPKGTDFTQVSKEEILEAQRKLNDRPRRALGYLKPDEVINQLVALKT